MVAFLSTDRLTLRALTANDADDLFGLYNDPAVMRFINGGRPVSRAEVVAELAGRLTREYAWAPGVGFWAAVDRATGRFLGWFSLQPQDDDVTHVELGYRLARDVWGQGFATEGACALVHKGFAELGVRRVFAQTMAVNAASRRVMEKAGLRFVRVFHLEWDDPIEGTEHGEVEYALSRQDWQAAG